MTVGRMRFGHSPDADDAYMFFGFARGDIRVAGHIVDHVLEEIEKLNLRAQRAELEITALSAHGYAYVSDHYAIMASGTSVARGYGPRLVAIKPAGEWLKSRIRIAVPGQFTTAHLLAKLFLPEFVAVFRAFDDVERALAAGEVDAAILIHEGQIELDKRGFHLILDLGARFMDMTGFPVPLGVDAVRRDLGDALMRAAQVALKSSIVYAQKHHMEALDYALPFGRGIDRKTADQFIRMYVNEDTLEMPEDVERGLGRLYEMAVERSLLPAVPRLDIVRESSLSSPI